MENKYFKEFELTQEQIAKIRELYPDEEESPTLIKSLKEIGINLVFRKADELAEYQAFVRGMRKTVYPEME